MKIKNLFLAVLMFATVSLQAQDVDKATVEAQAEAGKTAVNDLKKVDTGEKAWKFDGVVGLNAAATGLVNWAAGGKNNVNGVAYAKLHLLYHKDAIAWETNFDTDFGMTWIDQEEDKFQKSSDNIKLLTKFGWEFHKNWYLTVLGGFQSQYALGRDYLTGYDPIISKWLAPSYTDISVGIDWKTEVKGANFSIYLSPIAGRITTAYVGDKWNDKYTDEMVENVLVVDDKTYTPAAYIAAYQAGEAGFSLPAGVTNEEELRANIVESCGGDIRHQLQDAYGTYKINDASEKEYKNFRAEMGLSIKGALSYKYKDLTLTSALSLFTPYAWDKTEIDDEYFKYKDMNRRFGNFDVDWDVAISYQFLKVLNVTLQTSLKYYNGTLIENKDGVAAERVQFKSVLGLGIGYSF
mgnify:CR=1 FL=1